MTDADKSACCDGKHVFRSMRYAQQVARKMRREKNEPVAPYRCPVCHGIHLGGTE